MLEAFKQKIYYFQKYKIGIMATFYRKQLNIKIKPQKNLLEYTEEIFNW